MCALSLLDIGSNQCRFPVTAEKPFMFCAEPVARGPYCLKHFQTVYVPIKPYEPKAEIKRV